MAQHDPFQNLYQQLSRLQSINAGSAIAPRMRDMFEEGDRVVLLKGRGYDADPEQNPIWGKDDNYIAGTIRKQAGRSRFIVRWDHGRENMFDTDDCKLVLLDDAPRPKKVKHVKLDTTMLESLVIDDAKREEIFAVLKQHQNQDKIFKEWGLGETLEYGKGMTFMFYGPPGTGKTWGATCIAKALGTELLTISAAEIQSSEPGGANRAIQNAFAEAKSKGKVLFIDECDSLIANRAELGMILSSEVNTLLTEIEKCEGVVILATNRIENMDAALERRISLIIEFPMPNFDERVKIWNKLIPKKFPLAEDVKVESLAEHELSGGQIKNAILQAARLAVSKDLKAVELAQFNAAIDRIMSSKGLMGTQNRYAQRAPVGVASNGARVTKFLERGLDSEENV